MATQVPTLIAHTLRGIAIGAANTVPGVSGGTIAVVTGIYEALVRAVADATALRVRSAAPLLVPVAVGAAIGIVAFASLIERALALAPEPTAFFFMGLIAGSLPFIVREAGRPTARELVAAVGAAALVTLQALLAEPRLTDAITSLTVANAPLLLVAGIIATATMVVPGVSGSFVLLLLGLYATFIAAITAVNLPILAMIGVGAVIGLAGVSRLMTLLLTRARRITYWIIVGLVVGSLVGVWPGISGAVSPIVDVVALAVGGGLALALGGRQRATPEGAES